MSDTNVGKVSYDPWQGMYGSPPGEDVELPAPYYGSFPVVPTVEVGAWQEIVGAIAKPPVIREGLLAEVAPVLAPGTGGMTVSVDLDAKQQLHASICVDGKCYQGTVDLSGPIAAVMQKIAEQHKALHAQGATSSTTVSGDADVLGEVEKLVRTEGATLVGSLLGEHMDTAVSGWWDDLKGAASKAVKTVHKGVRRGVGTIEHTLVKLKGPIGTAAAAAAGAGALAVPGVGPVLAPMAGGLAKSLVEAAAGSGDVKAVAEAAIAQVKEKAQKDSNLKKVLGIAEKSVAQSTAAYQIAETVKAAAAGDESALNQVKKLAEAEASGDKAAKAAMDMAREISESLKKFDADPASVKFAAEASSGDAVGALPWWTIPAMWGGLAAHGMTGQAPWTSELAGRGNYRSSRVAGWQEIVGADRSDRVIATGRANEVPVLSEDGEPTGQFVMWKPTLDQIKRFGKKLPRYFTQDEGGLFLFTNDAGGWTPYKPTWQVRYVDAANQAMDDVVLEQARALQFADALTGQSNAIAQETNRRFWTQTGYKPGQKLDPRNTRDRAMMKVWRGLYAQVKADWPRLGTAASPQVAGEVVGSLPLAIGLVAAALAGYAWWKDHESKQLVDQAMTTASQADQAPDPVVKQELTQQAIAIAETAKAKAPRVTRPIDKKRQAEALALLKATGEKVVRQSQAMVDHYERQAAERNRAAHAAAAEQLLAKRIRAAQAAGLSPAQVKQMLAAEAAALAAKHARDAAYRDAFAGPKPQPIEVTLDLSQPSDPWA